MTKNDKMKNKKKVMAMGVPMTQKGDRRKRSLPIHPWYRDLHPDDHKRATNSIVNQKTINSSCSDMIVERERNIIKWLL